MTWTHMTCDNIKDNFQCPQLYYIFKYIIQERKYTRIGSQNTDTHVLVTKAASKVRCVCLLFRCPIQSVCTGR